MALITWNDRLSVAVPQIDVQHKKLVDMINHLHEAMKAGRGKDVVGPIVQDLVSYTKTHFRDEERYMQSIKFAGLERHMEQHNAFIAKVSEFQHQYEAGTMSLTRHIIDFLQHWLIDHIQKSDHEYVKVGSTGAAPVGR